FNEGKIFARSCPPHCPFRARLCRPETFGRARSPAFFASAVAHWPVPDRFRQRGGARALHAALFPPWPLSVGAARQRGHLTKTCCLRILGARGVLSAGRNLAADALAHGARGERRG